MIFFYYKCEKCGQVYYSAAELSEDQLICDRCGGKIRKIDQDELKEEVDE